MPGDQRIACTRVHARLRSQRDTCPQQAGSILLPRMNAESDRLTCAHRTTRARAAHPRLLLAHGHRWAQCFMVCGVCRAEPPGHIGVDAPKKKNAHTRTRTRTRTAAATCYTPLHTAAERARGADAPVIREHRRVVGLRRVPEETDCIRMAMAMHTAVTPRLPNKCPSACVGKCTEAQRLQRQPGGNATTCVRAHAVSHPQGSLVSE